VRYGPRGLARHHRVQLPKEGTGIGTLRLRAQG
jgi:hypothetical protein